MKLSCIGWIVLIIVIIILIWFIVNSVSKNTLYNTGQSIELMTSQKSNNNSDFKLYYFYHPSCGYCIQFMPIWEKVKQNYLDNNISTVDTSKPENENLSFYYNVNKYPTIILSTKNKNIEYTGDRSLEDINRFIATHI